MKSMKGKIVDVVNREIFNGEITIENGKIAAVRHIDEEANGYIMPGFVDSHIHIESTLLTPEKFAPLAMKQGTIAVVADPHEIANVLGREGIEYMIESGRQTPLKFAWMVPSCVPSTCFETAGACLNADDVREMLSSGKFKGLAEMMNFPGVLFGDAEVLAKIKAAKDSGLVIDGHAPGVTGDDARKYVAAGISTDHEMFDLSQARERIALGMKVQLREGSAACNLDDLMPLLEDKESEGQLMFCTDDKYPDELAVGHINEMAARCIAKGYDLWRVLEAACVTPVRHYNLDCGLLQEGDSADFIVVEDLKSFNVCETWIEGTKVGYVTTERDSVVLNNFNAKPLSVEEIAQTANGKVKVIVASEGQLYTRCEEHETTDDDVLKLIVYNRYNEAKPAIGYIKGFGLKRGAIASTIAHDSHNIIALGVTDEEIVRAINTLIESKGGFCVVDGEKVMQLALPIAGLMSTEDGTIVGQKHIELKKKAAEIGCRFKAPYMTLAFMALPVIPELKLTDKGLFDGVKFQFC